MSSNKPKDNSRKSGDARARREQRQLEAAARKKAAAQRTPDQQLAVLRARGITSGAEFDRLYALVESGAGKLKKEKK